MSKKIKVMLIILGIVLLMVTYSIWKHYQKFSPVINPKPSQFIMVSGHLDQGFYLKIGASYAADEKICWHYSNYVEGLTQPNFHQLIYAPIIDRENNYTVKIPLDGLQSGHCHWIIGGLYSIVSSTQNFSHINESMLFRFYSKAVQINNPSLLIKCSIYEDNGIDCFFKGSNFDYPNIYSKTSSIEINFMKEEKHV